MEPTITFRPIQPEDEPFLYSLYASTREEELSLVPWNAAERESFLRMQFSAQHKFYMEQYLDACFEIIEANGRSVGRLYVDRREDEIRLIDIALMTQERNRGIGSRLLKDLLAESARVGKPVRIHVERFNPALRLYERLGFEPIDDQGVYFLMEWSPERAAAPLEQGGTQC